jgi:hypothetical protein
MVPGTTKEGPARINVFLFITIKFQNHISDRKTFVYTREELLYFPGEKKRVIRVAPIPGNMFKISKKLPVDFFVDEG